MIDITEWQKQKIKHMNEESRGLKDESRRSYSEYRMMKAKDQTENDEEWSKRSYWEWIRMNNKTTKYQETTQTMTNRISDNMIWGALAKPQIKGHQSQELEDINKTNKGTDPQNRQIVNKSPCGLLSI